MIDESQGQRGKAAEKEVVESLKKLNESLEFAYFRLPDARAARGRLAASPADFIYFFGDASGFIEVKSTKHPYRLGRSAFSQLPALRKFQHSGASNLLLVHHSSEGSWRAVDPRGLDPSAPSWDLSAHEKHPTADAALRSFWRECRERAS